MSRKRPKLSDVVKDVALKLAREAERYVGAQDTSACTGCGHERQDHCGCGTVCLAPDDPADRGKSSYRHCSCKGFAAELREDG